MKGNIQHKIFAFDYGDALLHKKRTACRTFAIEYFGPEKVCFTHH